MDLIQSHPTGKKEKFLLNLHARKRLWLTSLQPLNAESLCFPYEIFNNLRMLSALCAVLHQLGAKHSGDSHLGSYRHLLLQTIHHLKLFNSHVITSQPPFCSA